MQILHIEQEVVGDDRSVLQTVLGTDFERADLLQKEKELIDSGKDDGLKDVYDRLAEIGADAAEPRAAEILSGLGFTTEMQVRPTKEFSGGWRMRVAISQALFIHPDILLLDEPTNHLDLHGKDTVPHTPIWHSSVPYAYVSLLSYLLSPMDMCGYMWVYVWVYGCMHAVW